MSLAHFHEVSLPMPIALMARGGPERSVEIVPLGAGREARNAASAGSRRRWEIGSPAMPLDLLQTVSEFFEARGGPLHGFRFHDRLDHSSARPGAAISSADQLIGIGDGNARAFTLVKTYGAWRRRIWKPVAGTVQVAVAGVCVEAACDIANGIVTIPQAPEPGVPVTAGFMFDCPVRFDTARLEATFDSFGGGRFVRIPLIEITG